MCKKVTNTKNKTKQKSMKTKQTPQQIFALFLHFVYFLGRNIKIKSCAPTRRLICTGRTKALGSIRLLVFYFTFVA